MSVPLKAGEASGEALRFEGGVLHVVLDRAFAPGKPTDLQLTLGGDTLSLRGKSLGSKRREDDRFDVRLRMLSLRKGERAALAALAT